MFVLMKLDGMNSLAEFSKEVSFQMSPVLVLQPFSDSIKLFPIAKACCQNYKMETGIPEVPADSL